MGFSISWLGFENVSKADVSARLNMIDTEVADEANEAPPEAVADIRRRLAAKQLEAGGREAAVDYIFDGPVELAAALTGYRHDRMRFAWGEPQFTVVAATD